MKSCAWKQGYVFLFIALFALVGCGEPEAQIIYQEGATPLMPGGGGTGGGGGGGGGGGLMDMGGGGGGGGMTNTNPGVGDWPPSDPSQLGPTTPISSYPCTLTQNSLQAVEGTAKNVFQDGVLSCMSPALLEFVYINWEPAESYDLYIRVGGSAAAWQRLMGTTSISSPSRAEVESTMIPGNTQVDFYIDRFQTIDEMYLVFQEPGEGG